MGFIPEPRGEVYWFRLNFNITKLVYCYINLLGIQNLSIFQKCTCVFQLKIRRANRYLYIRCYSLFKSFLKNLAHLPLCCPVQMEGLVFRMCYHQIVRIDIYPCVNIRNTNTSEKKQQQQQDNTHTSLFQALVSRDDRKSRQATSEVWERKRDPVRR